MDHRNTRSGKLTFLLLTLVALAAFQPGFAEDQEIEQLRNAAEQEDADAQYKLASVYVKGNGVSKNHVESVKWLRKAAENGHAEAQDKVGGLYDAISTEERGTYSAVFDKRLLRLSKGTPEENDREAVRWLYKGALQGGE